MSEEPRSILVINVSRIGDTLFMTPAIRALSRAWPAARITLLGHPKRMEVLQHLPEAARVGPITKHRARWKGWLPFRRYDLAVVYGFDRPLVAYALRVARQVVAFRQGDSRLDQRLYRCIERPGFQSMHLAESPLLLTRALAVPDAGLRLSYVVTADEQDQARQFVRTRLPRPSSPLIGFQIASFPTKGYRDWPAERFIELAQRIFQRWPQAHLLCLGGPLERERTAAVAVQFPGRATNVAGSLTLRQSAALMNELDLYVGVDTGPTNIMGALNRPMVALYHCYLPSRFLRPMERTQCYVIDHPRTEGCSPETPMGELSVDPVWAKVQEALAAFP